MVRLASAGTAGVACAGGCVRVSGAGGVEVCARRGYSVCVELVWAW